MVFIAKTESLTNVIFFSMKIFLSFSRFQVKDIYHFRLPPQKEKINL